jgi:hypothetical protein
MARAFVLFDNSSMQSRPTAEARNKPALIRGCFVQMRLAVAVLALLPLVVSTTPGTPADATDVCLHSLCVPWHTMLCLLLSKALHAHSLRLRCSHPQGIYGYDVDKSGYANDGGFWLKYVVTDADIDPSANSTTTLHVALHSTHDCVRFSACLFAALVSQARTSRPPLEAW